MHRSVLDAKHPADEICAHPGRVNPLGTDLRRKLGFRRVRAIAAAKLGRGVVRGLPLLYGTRKCRPNSEQLP